MINTTNDLPRELKQGLIIPCILLILTIFMVITSQPASADAETVIKKCSILINN